MREANLFDESLKHIETYEKQICDQLMVEEIKGTSKSFITDFMKTC